MYFDSLFSVGPMSLLIHESYMASVFEKKKKST